MDVCTVGRALIAQATHGEDGGSTAKDGLTNGGMAWDGSRRRGRGTEDGVGERGRRGRGARNRKIRAGGRFFIVEAGLHFLKLDIDSLLSGQQIVSNNYIHAIRQ